MQGVKGKLSTPRIGFWIVIALVLLSEALGVLEYLVALLLELLDDR